MSRYVRAGEAAELLGVQRATLYAYVSRGLLTRRTAIDGRSSLYDADEVETLAAGRARSRPEPPRPSLDVQIATAITQLDDDGPRYRGRDVAELARSQSFESVAEFLWTGVLAADAAWPEPEPGDVRRAERARRLVRSPLDRISVLITLLHDAHPEASAVEAARLLYGLLPALWRDPKAADVSDPRLAAQLAAAWAPGSPPALASAVKRALIVMADHELATATLAVRLAASVRSSPWMALAAGVAVVQGALHGGAANHVHRLFDEVAELGAAATIRRRLDAGERIPGFGHRIYRGEDPRLAPMEEAIGMLEIDAEARAMVQEVRTAVVVATMQHPNVDFALGSLTWLTGMSADTPIFAVARLAGFTAHYLEELEARPVRYRGIARPI